MVSKLSFKKTLYLVSKSTIIEFVIILNNLLFENGSIAMILHDHVPYNFDTQKYIQHIKCSGNDKIMKSGMDR